MALLITDIGELVTNDPEAPGADPGSGSLGIVRDAAVLVAPDGRGGRSRIEWVGPRADAPQDAWEVSVEGRAAVPGFVDSHTHLVYAGDRAEEFCARMFGDEYDGGGIANTVRATREASDADLRGLLAARIKELRGQGTTTVEIKSGYGLDVEHEARMLQIAREVTDETTYLGGHVVPPEYADRRAEYVDLVTGPMLDACAPHARWGDVFCEPNSPHAFTREESEAILRACAAKGLELRVHGNQIGHGPGVQLAVELGAASVDHCTYLSDADVAALAGSGTVATLLPGVEFSTKSPYPDARRLIDAGVRVAIASDCNPGTCNSSSMPLMIALAVREMGMRPAEALQAATVHAAAALRRTDVGVVTAGAVADIAVLDAPSYLHLAYRPGVPIAHALEV